MGYPALVFFPLGETLRKMKKEIDRYREERREREKGRDSGESMLKRE